MAGSSFVMVRASGRPIVHLVHPASGNSGSYAALAAAVPARWTVTASDDPGLADTVSDMARLYLAELLPQVGSPDVIGGWSMGGLVAFEAIHQLRRGGAARLPGLFLIDSPPPVGYGAGSRPADLPREFARLLWEKLELPAGEFPVLNGDDDDVSLRAVAAALRRVGHFIEAGWLAARLAEYRRHRAAIASYTCADPLGVPALLVAGDLMETHIDSWRALLGPDVVVARAAGGHFDLLSQPLVGQVADLLTEFAERPCQLER